jgi:hypothetical protein
LAALPAKESTTASPTRHRMFSGLPLLCTIPQPTRKGVFLVGPYMFRSKCVVRTCSRSGKPACLFSSLDEASPGNTVLSVEQPRRSSVLFRAVQGRWL